MRSRLTAFTVLCFALAALWLALRPAPLTDGDSCLFAAIGHEMATDGWRAWIAPHWAFQGEPADFYEHPPGAMWPMAALETLGLDDQQAPLIANLLWLGLLLYSLWHLAGKKLPDKGPGLGALAALLMLLSFPLWKYVARAGLEIPFAACVTACVAAARAPALSAPLWLGLAFFGALMTRGVFALAVPVILLASVVLTGRHSLAYRARMVVGLILGTGLAAGYDLLHVQAMGHAFWEAYTDKQVLPSLETGGTPHANQGATLLYYGGRLLLYGLPWWLIAAVGAWWARRHAAWRVLSRDVYTALIWIAVFFVGVVVARRQGSRYLFAVWPALAWLTATVWSGAWRRLAPRARRGVAGTAAALVLLLTVGKSLFPSEEEWVETAAMLRAVREGAAAAGSELPPVHGPFAGHDDRMKQFIRHHLGVWALRAPEEGAPPGSLRFVAPGEPALAGETTLVDAPLFRLVQVP